MTEQQPITEFIAARLQDDEDAARAKIPGDRVRVVSRCGCPTIENADDAERAHMARRALRQVEAGRALLAAYQHAHDTWDIVGQGYIMVERAVHVLAATWDTHPDFDPKWSST